MPAAILFALLVLLFKGGWLWGETSNVTTRGANGKTSHGFNVKPGADISDLSYSMRYALSEAQHVYEEYGAGFVVTSGTDGQHLSTKDGGRHYVGEAADVRIWTLAEGDRRDVADVIQQRLGGAYYVLLESDHIHIEHNP